MTCDNYDYYYCGLTRDIIVIIEYPCNGSTSRIFIMIVSFKSPIGGVAQTPDCGISFKALYVVSLRRPTVAFLLKPFMWCRSDARLWHFF